MGSSDDLEATFGYALPSIPLTAPRAAEEEILPVARSWAGLTTQGRILISAGKLGEGHDANLLLAHETAHHILLYGTMFGLQQLALSTFALPPMPDGRLRRQARRLLNVSVAASTRVQEACATFLPSLRLSPSQQDAYWPSLPAAYQEMAAVFGFLPSSGLDPDQMQSVAFAISGFALAVRVPTSAFADPAALRLFLDDPAHSPDQRLTTACYRLARSRPAELLAVAESGSPIRMIDELCSAVHPVENEHLLSDGEGWAGAWAGILADLVETWRQDSPELSKGERAMVTAALEEPLTIVELPGPGVLKAIAVNTSSAYGPVLDDPPVDVLLRFNQVQLSYNAGEEAVPGIERVDGQALPLSQGQVALWLIADNGTTCAARVDEKKLRAFLDSAPTDTTICAYDGGYSFFLGDVFGAGRLLHGRPHLVLVQQRTPQGLLREIELTQSFDGDHRLLYTLIDGETPGLKYLLLRPEGAPYPLVIAPMPAPTAQRLVQEIESRTGDTVQWRRTSMFDVLTGDRAGLHLIRTCAYFEGKSLPDALKGIGDDPLGLGPPTESQGCGGDALDKLDGEVRARLDRAGALEVMGRLADAELQYAAMMSSPDPLTAVVGAIAVGMLHSHRGDPQQAIAAYLVAGRSEVTDFALLARIYLGQTLQVLGDMDRARLMYLGVAGSGHPDHSPPAALLLGRLLEPASKNEAIRAFGWVVQTRHPEVAPLALSRIRELLWPQQS